MLADNTRLPVEEAPHSEQLLQCCFVTAMRYGRQQGAAHAGSRAALCGTSCCNGSAFVRPQLSMSPVDVVLLMQPLKHQINAGCVEASLPQGEFASCPQMLEQLTARHILQ